ncbi:MAG: O-acetylhomoserine sulfhydrylase / O-succinylhomoserine sulfhydrylase [uncultured Adhaeribacter sp.]|uniref:O-succinylhomoserine sulfhydrylase n=1 Tax=uncultured Adhaeribacter sp. TaxID=448109 RepID=A0A6J4IHU2_9BACT|nr:MAG: O-acetylhomoserine sulfhydrylase / O-succinylhomoserine sulfhydrylase [uncultured Adhaeribacter sp.]
MEHNETKVIRTQPNRSELREHSSALYLTSSFTFETAEQGRALFADELEGNIYSRFSNPNTSEFISKMCLLEGAEDGFAFATGMAAVFAGFGAILQSGDHILASRSVFGSTHQLFNKVLSKWGITYTYADAARPAEWEALIQPNTKLVYIETPSNPQLELIDMEWLGKLCKKHNLIFSVDNCFATPYLQTPIQYGADLIIHSATKFIDGQGRVLGGVIVGRQDLIDEIRFFARHTGPALSPFNAWILSKSLETLPVRMDRHCQNALQLAQYLEGHAQLENTLYPFLPSHPQYELAKKQMKQGGGIVTFVVKGGYARAHQFMDALQIASKTANLGDTRTTVTHPASTTHSKLTDDERAAVGISDGLIRISVGLENINDLIADVEQALVATKVSKEISFS